MNYDDIFYDDSTLSELESKQSRQALYDMIDVLIRYCEYKNINPLLSWFMCFKILHGIDDETMKNFDNHYNYPNDERLCLRIPYEKGRMCIISGTLNNPPCILSREPIPIISASSIITKENICSIVTLSGTPWASKNWRKLCDLENYI